MQQLKRFTLHDHVVTERVIVFGDVLEELSVGASPEVQAAISFALRSSEFGGHFKEAHLLHPHGVDRSSGETPAVPPNLGANPSANPGARL